MKKKYVISSLFTLSVISGLYFLPKFLQRKKLELYGLAGPESTLTNLTSKILSDRQELEQYEFFKGSLGNRDAGEYLNTKVPFSEEEKSSLLNIDPEVTGKLHQKDWYTLNLDTSVLDFSWMERLSDFDFWSPDLSNPKINLKDRPAVFDLPLPEYIVLVDWTKLRLIHGFQTNTLPTALKEVRQLARLIYTNDNRVSAMSAIAILRVESNFLSKNNLAIDGWKSLSDETLHKAKRYFWALPSFVDPRLTDETFSKLSKTTVGECMMVSEGLSPMHMIKTHLSSEFAKEIARYETLINQSLKTCRNSIAHIAWRDPQWKAMTFDPIALSSGNISGWYFSKNLPLLASEVLNLESPAFSRFKLYEEAR